MRQAKEWPNQIKHHPPIAFTGNFSRCNFSSSSQHCISA